MTYSHLLVERHELVERVTLNRPDVRNAFNEALIAELTHWASTCEGPDAPRVAILAGSGPAFCAGADLAWMSSMAGYSRDENLRDASALARMFAALDALPIPLIGRVQGAVLGGGCGLVAVCDIVAAEELAVFGFTEVKLGLIPATIGPYVVAKIGLSAARELFLTGMRFPAQRAVQIGLVHAAVPTDSLDRAVDLYVRELLGGAPGAITAVKQLLPRLAGRPPAECLTMTAEAIAAQRVSPEGQEGMQAFLAKRRASWRAD